MVLKLRFRSEKCRAKDLWNEMALSRQAISIIKCIEK